MGAVAYIADRLSNLMTGAGTSADRRVMSHYALNRMDQAQIEASYRSSWLMRKAIDLPPYDMTRAGRDWQADKPQIEALEAEEKRLGLWDKLKTALVLGRLGGGAIIIGTSGDPSQPLAAESMGKGALTYLYVASRWRLSLGEMVTDPADPWFGQPSYFQLSSDRQSARIHPSRVIAFRGQQVPDMATTNWQDVFWGDPVAQSIMDAVKNADMAQNGFASLIDEAKLDIIKMPGLMQNAATADYEKRFNLRWTLANQGKSTHRALIIDGDETWEQRQVNWAGMPEIIRAYVSIVAGATDIPATRLLGKSPDGMNATGDGDQNNYDQMIAGKQENDLRPAIERIDEVLIRSASVDPAKVWWRYAPLSVLTEAEEATVFNTNMDAITKLQNTGTIPDEAMAKGVQNLMSERGWVPGLEGALAEMPEGERFGLTRNPDDDAEGGDPSDLAGGRGEEAPRRRAANDGKGGGPNADLPFADGKRRKGAQRGGASHFREQDHPRQPDGTFAYKGGVETPNSFAGRAMARPGENRDFMLGKVQGNSPNHIAGFDRVMNSQEVRKNLNKHGDPNRLVDGQPPISTRDFAHIPEITRVGSYRELGERSGRKPQRIEYRATIDGHRFVYTEVVGAARKRVALLSFYRLD